MISFYKQKAEDLKRSFSSISGAKQHTHKVEPLPGEFFSSLIETESYFRSNSYTVETLDILVQLYARAVEYYDSLQDNISSYFTYKIQDVLATKRSLKMLIDKKEQDKADQSKEIQSSKESPESVDKANKLVQNSICETLAEDSSDEDGEKSRREEWNKRKEAKKPVKSLTSLKSQKQRFVQFYHQLEVENDNHKQSVQVMFNEYIETAKENDQTVQNCINIQKRVFKQKLQQRKNKSFLASALNSTFNSANSPCLPAFKKIDFTEDILLEEINDDKPLEGFNTSSVKKRLKSQSLFARKNNSNQLFVETSTYKEEIGAKELEYLTPTEKLSTENSLTIEFNMS